MALLNFVDLSNVTERREYTPLPAGFYQMQVIDSLVKETKSGTGEYLELQMEIMDGEFAGRKYWERLNLWNQSEKAVDIAKQTYLGLLKAQGKATATGNSEDLHFVPMMVQIKLQRNNKTGQLENIAVYLSGEAAEKAFAQLSVGHKAPARAAAPVSATASAGAPPWAKHKSMN